MPEVRHAIKQIRGLTSGIGSVYFYFSNVASHLHAPAHVVALTYVGAAAGFVSHHTGVWKLSGPW